MVGDAGDVGELGVEELMLSLELAESLGSGISPRLFVIRPVMPASSQASPVG